ncbi:MAG: hypothetical protein NQ127_04190 [Candidatus Cardinium sp.]|nr:hypothetical protein [Candidatus Cardinium sp.]
MLPLKIALFTFFVLSSFFPLYGQKKLPMMEWKNCVHYLMQFPNYEGYQPPQDILKEGCPWGNWVTFPQKILTIEVKVSPWKDPIELFKSKDFEAMYHYPDYYQEAVLDYLANPDYNDNQKKICVYAMRHISDIIDLLEEVYYLYQAKKLSTSVFEILVKQVFIVTEPHKWVNKRKNKLLDLLQAIVDMPVTTVSLKKVIKRALSGLYPDDCPYKDNFPKSYNQYAGISFPQKTCDAIQQEYIEYDPYYIPQDVGQSSSYIPEFLILVDHPSHYLMSGNYYIFDQPKCQSKVARFWAIVMMHQLGAFQGDILKYDVLINSACNYYYFSPDSTKGMSLLLMESLFLRKGLSCFKYPFFILNQEDKDLQKVLHRFIALPTIPCGLKEIAKKILAGTLATPQEMEYMKGYIAFRKKYFTLYETVLPSQ